MTTTISKAFQKLLLLIFYVQLCTSSDADLNELLNGVSEISCEGCLSGMMAVFGPNAFPVIASTYEGALNPAISAAMLGQGRIVAFSHDTFMNLRPGVADSDRFLLNSINWAARFNDIQPKPKASVLNGFYTAEPLVDFLNGKGYEAVIIPYEELLNVSRQDADILIIPNMRYIQQDAVDGLKSYVTSGGGVVTALTNWVNTELDSPGNQFLRDSGMIWVPDLATYATTSINTFNASRDLLRDLHGMSTSSDLIAYINSQDEVPEEGRLSQMFTTLRYNINYIGKQDLSLFNELREAIETLKPINPTDGNPVAASPMNIFHYSLEMFLYNAMLEPEEITVHPSALRFPGLGHPNAIVGNQKTTKKHRISLPVISVQNFTTKSHISYHTTLNWYSTGLYAQAGAVITAQLYGNGEKILSFSTRIGCHKDDLSRKPEWFRFPNVGFQKYFEGDFGTISSPFGGLIYIQVVVTEEPLKNLTVEITGGIPTPSFTLGKTSLDEWTNNIKTIDAPWAEFISDHVILSIPGDLAQTIVNPEELMTFWENALKETSTLVSRPIEDNFQRYVFDMDISGGYMHSGFPIMAYLGSVQNAVNITYMTGIERDVWGLFHELGHNHQKREWTLEGGGEVTCNFLPMYVMTEITNHTFPEANLIFCPPNMCYEVTNYIAGGTNYFANFAGSESLPLIYYYQLQQLFGWDAYQRVFKTYAELLPEERPATPDQIRDMWLVIFSKTVERNLAGFFRSWGIPFSAGAEAQVSHLPLSGLLITDLCAEDPLPVPEICV